MTKPCLYLISISDSNRLLTLQGKPNHMTYEHPKGLIWQPFASSPPKFPHCNVARGSVPLVSRAPTRVFQTWPQAVKSAGKVTAVTSHPVLTSYVGLPRP